MSEAELALIAELLQAGGAPGAAFRLLAELRRVRAGLVDLLDACQQSDDLTIRRLVPATVAALLEGDGP